MMVLPNDWVEGSQCSPPVSNDDTAQSVSNDEHLVNAKMVIDKTLLANRPLWIPRLNLSKAFDRVDWDALWRGLRLHGASAHVVWLLQVVYPNQTGQITEHSEVSREFCINAGVRQGRVLSPRLFCSALPLAMEDWQCDVSWWATFIGSSLCRRDYVVCKICRTT